MSDLSPFEINRQVREREEHDRDLRRRIQRTSQAPDEILTIVNFALGVMPGEGDKTIVNIVKANGRQLQLVFNPEARRALMRELQAAEDAPGGASNGALELPGS